MKAVFYRPDYQKLLTSPLIKRYGQPFIWKYVTEPLKHSAELLKHSAELLKHSVELLRISEKTKSSAALLCYNTAHAVQITHGKKALSFCFVRMVCIELDIYLDIRSIFVCFAVLIGNNSYLYWKLITGPPKS